MGLCIWANRNAGNSPCPWARCAGPPRSRSQYQNANTKTLVNQIAAPMSSSAPADSVSVPDARPRIKRNAEKALPKLTMPTIVIGNENDGVHPMATAQWWATALSRNAKPLEVPSKTLDLAAHEAATRKHVWGFLNTLPRKSNGGGGN